MHQTHKSRSTGNSGFTLIETLVVVAIVAILAAIAAPSFQIIIRNNRLSAAASALQVSLSLARSEAVKRGPDARVTVVANTTAGAWGNGWTVFVDGTGNASNGVAPTADSSTVSRLDVVAAPAASISYSQTVSTPNYFTYNGQGRLVDNAGAAAKRSFWFYESDSDKYCLIINSTGRVRTDRVPSASNCATD